MKTSQSGLMSQLCRVLFLGEGENNDNRAPQLEGGCLANLTIASKPKSRRGKRQKWNRHDSNGGSSNDDSILAGIHTVTQRNSSTVEHVEGGLFSLLAMSAMEKENTRKVNRNRSASIVTSSLLGAMKIDYTDSQSQKPNKHARRRGQQMDKVDVLQRITKSRSDATSLIPKIQTSSISVLVAEPDVRSQRKESVHNVKEDIASVLVALPQKSQDNTGQPMTFGDAAQARKIYRAITLSQTEEKLVSFSLRSPKALKRKKTGMKSDAITSSFIEFTALNKADEDGAFMTTADSSESDSETKPTKRMNTRPTPSKLAANDANVVDLTNAIDSLALTSTMDDEKEDQTKPSPRMKPGSRVLELEYIPVSTYVLPRMEKMAEADSDVIMETNELEMRRSSRSRVQTDRFSPSLAMKQVQLMAAKSSSESRDQSISFPASPQSGEVTNADDTNELVEPVKRRSGRRQIPTDMFSPSVAMKQVQLKAARMQDGSKRLSSKTKIAKSVLREKQRNHLPPKSRLQATIAVPLPNPGNDSHEPDAINVMQLASPLTYLSQKMQVMQASRNECHEQKTENATSEKQASSGNDLSNKMQASHVTMNTETVSNKALSEAWNDKQLLQLQQWQSQVNPTSSIFWVEIAEHVDGKSAQECREKWFSLVKTPDPRAKRVAKNDANRHVPDKAAAQLKTNDEDDIFNSTPLRGALFPNGTKLQMEPAEMKNINFDLGSPLLMSARRDRRVSTEYDVGSAISSLQPKVGYKSYLMGLKRGVAKAKRDKKITKKKQNLSNGTARNMTESVGDGDISLKCKLSPGGTLQVENLTEVEDDFMYRSWDLSDCDE